MKANKVLKLLKITRPTLSKYVRLGKIKTTCLSNGFYEYDDDSVYSLLNKDSVSKNVIYCRVSSPNQKEELQKQKSKIENYCSKKGIDISDVYEDISSGICMNGEAFQKMFDEIVQRKISSVYVFSNDRISYSSFCFIESLFERYDCKIVCIQQNPKEKIVEKEVFDELIPVVENFSKNMYSDRRKQKIFSLAEELKMEKDVL